MAMPKVTLRFDIAEEVGAISQKNQAHKKQRAVCLHLVPTKKRLENFAKTINLLPKNSIIGQIMFF